MRLRSWLADKVIAWGWARLTPEQRVAWLGLRRYDLLATLTTQQHLHILEAVLPPDQRLTVACALAASSTPPAAPAPTEQSYVY
jgi:hypothetical protein